MTVDGAGRPDIGTTRIGRGLEEDGKRSSPYGRPILKEPVWTWEIPCYLYAGGLAGASATLAQLTGMAGDERLAKRLWHVALGGAIASPALLVSDLGRPARFLNMLRMFKVTSPMSVGSWILSAFGTATGVTALNTMTGGAVPPLRAAARVTGPAAAALGLPLASYTGALISNTAIPAWHEARMLMPAVFVAGAAASAGGAAVALAEPRAAGSGRRLAIGGAVAEMVLKNAMERRLGELRAAYESPVPKRFTWAARLLLGAGVVLCAGPGRRDRRAAAAGGALVNLGALSARWAIFKAGFASAARPDDTVLPQRARIDAGLTRGAARRARPGERPVDRAVASPATTGPREGP